MSRSFLPRALAVAVLALPLPAQTPARPLTLGDAARLAAEQSAAAQVARLRASEASARATQSRAALLPTVTASLADGQRTFNTASFGFTLPGLNPDGVVLGPVRTVDVRGRVVAPVLAPAALGRYRSAQAAVTGADAEARAVAEQSAAVAALAYVRTLRGEGLVAARSADSSLAAELLEIARRQLAAGVGVALDVTRAQAQLAAVRTQLIGARNERDRARLDLVRALGLPLDAVVTLADSLDGEAPVALDPSAAQAAARARPDVAAATAAVEVATRALRAARAERLPTLGVFADDGVISRRYAHLLPTYTTGIQLSVPVFEGFRHGAREAELTASLRQAEARRDDLLRQAETDLAVAQLDLSSAREQVAASRERLRLAEQEVAQARERFRAGVTGNAEVISAQLALDAARGQHVDVLTGLQTARLTVARAQGRVTALP